MRFKGTIIPYTLTVIKEPIRFKILVVKISQFHELYIFEVGLLSLLPEDVHELEESAVGDLVLDFIHELGEPVTCGDVHVRSE